MHLLFKEAEMKITVFAHFKEYHGNHENKFKSLYGFEGRLVLYRF